MQHKILRGVYMEYAKIYETENAIVRIITPEQILGRPMTDEEKEKVLQEVRKANEAILIGLHKRGLRVADWWQFYKNLVQGGELNETN